MMVRVTIDAAVRSTLGNLDSLVEFCDEAGRVVGHFIPVEDRAIYQGVESPVNDEELDRRLDAESERSLGEALRDLESRP